MTLSRLRLFEEMVILILSTFLGVTVCPACFHSNVGATEAAPFCGVSVGVSVTQRKNKKQIQEITNPKPR
jgi:hypothetical protein